MEWEISLPSLALDLAIYAMPFALAGHALAGVPRIVKRAVQIAILLLASWMALPWLLGLALGCDHFAPTLMSSDRLRVSPCVASACYGY